MSGYIIKTTIKVKYNIHQNKEVHNPTLSYNSHDKRKDNWITGALHLPKLRKTGTAIRSSSTTARIHRRT